MSLITLIFNCIEMKNSILISLGIALSGLLLGIFIRSAAGVIVDSRRTVEVRGLSEREVTANKVTWPIVYKIVGNELQSLYSTYEKNNKTVVAYLNEHGVSADEISVNAPDITDNQAQGYSSNAPYRYNLTGVITVTSDKVESVQKLINSQGELLKQGIAVTASDWNYKTIYEYTALNDIKPEMIADATNNARKAADKFAEDSGARVGRLLSAHQGQFSIDDRDPYTPYIKRIRVVTSLQYEIK